MPDSIFFEKSISKNKLKKLTKIKRFGHKIVNLDEEGMASQNNKHFYIKQRLSKKTLDLIEYFFTWGDNEKKLIEDNYQEYKYKVKTTGNPRIDAWKPDYIELYKNEIYQINQKYKNYIFIASNFALLQHARGNEFIIKQSKVPVIIDAGIGTASDATIAMELGCDGVLINSAIANSKKPVLMARAFRDAVIAGRNSFLAGRMKKNYFASPSSPIKGLI